MIFRRVFEKIILLLWGVRFSTYNIKGVALTGNRHLRLRTHRKQSSLTAFTVTQRIAAKKTQTHTQTRR